MIIWSGLGLFIPVIVFAVCLTVAFPLQSITGSEAAYHSYGMPIALLISAALIYFLGKRLNGVTKTYIDKKTGEEIIIKKNHSLFFIPMEYWGHIVAVIAVGAWIYGIFNMIFN